MGRFYRTSVGAPIDYMYRINAPLMQTVMAANDAGITQTLNADDLLDAKKNFNYISTDPGDAELARTESQNIDNQANTIASNIQGDYANWRKQLPAIRQFSKSVSDNYINGNISKLMGSYNAMKTNFDTLDQGVALYNKTGGVDKNGNDIGISPIRAQMAKAYAIGQYKGAIDKSTGAYTPFKGIDLMGDINIKNRLGKELDKMKADGYSFTNDDFTQGGQYINKTKGSVEGVSPQRVLGELTNRLMGDQGLMDYFRQDQLIGHSKNILDSEGRLISPYDYAPISDADQANIDLYKDKISKITDPVEREKLIKLQNQAIQQANDDRQVNWHYDKTPLANIMAGLVGQYSYSKTSRENTFRANPVWTTTYIQNKEDNRQAKTLGQAWQIHKDTQKAIQDRFDDNLDWEKYKFNHPQATGKGSKSSGTKATADNSVPSESFVNQFGTNTLNSLTTTDPDTKGQIPLLSDKGLDARYNELDKNLNNIHSQIGDLDKQIAATTDPFDAKILQAQKEQLQKQYTILSIESDKISDWKDQTDEAVLNNSEMAGNNPLHKDEIALYRKFAGNDDLSGNKFKAHIADLRKKYPDTSQGANGQYGYLKSPQVVEAEKELANFNKAKARVSANKDIYLQNISKDYITSNGIVPNQQDEEAAKNILFSNPVGSQIFDNLGKPAKGITLSHGYQWIHNQEQPSNMSFEGDNNLKDYIDKYDVKTHIKVIGATTGLGNGGAVLKVTFDDPHGKIPTTPFYISASPQVTAALGTRFSQSSNPQINTIGKSMLDPVANDIKNQLARGSNVITVTNKGKTYKFGVTRLPGEGNHIALTRTNKDGKTVPVERITDEKGKPIGGYNGLFDSWDEGIAHIEAQMQKSNQQQ